MGQLRRLKKQLSPNLYEKDYWGDKREMRRARAGMRVKAIITNRKEKAK